MKIVHLIAAPVLAIALTATSIASGQEDFKYTQKEIDSNPSKVINNPKVGDYWLAGEHQTNSEINDAGVPGSRAKRVKVDAPGEVWEASAHSAISRTITKGDEIIVSVWLKADKGSDGDSEQVNLRLEGTNPPYSSPGEKLVSISSEWQLYSFKVVADATYESGKANMVIQYGHAKRVLFVGPVYVLDMGKSA